MTMLKCFSFCIEMVSGSFAREGRMGKGEINSSVFACWGCWLPCNTTGGIQCDVVCVLIETICVGGGGGGEG